MTCVKFLVPLCAHIERSSVSRMQSFFFKYLFFYVYVYIYNDTRKSREGGKLKIFYQTMDIGLIPFHRISPSLPMQIFKASHWPSDHIIRSWPLIGLSELCIFGENSEEVQNLQHPDAICVPDGHQNSVSLMRTYP